MSVGPGEEESVAVLGHPLGSGELALPRTVGAGGVARGIDVQDDARDLGPFGAISFRIKDSQIGDEVLHVVAREGIYVRNLVSAVRIERCSQLRHGDGTHVVWEDSTLRMRRNDGASEHIG
jgi:hypothetical protein